MINSKLFQILKTFSRDEFKECEKFILSPFFSKGRDLVPLFNVLKNYYPDFDNAKLTYENLFVGMYGSKKYSYELINKMFSEMIKASEEYLMQISLKKDFMIKKHLVLRELISRKIDSRFKVHIKETEVYLKSRSLYRNYYSDMVLLEDMKFNFNYYKDKQELVTENVVRRSHYKIMNFLVSAGHEIHDLSVNGTAFNSPFKDTLMHKFLSAVNFQEFLNKLNDDPLYDTDLIKFFLDEISIPLCLDKKNVDSYKKYFFENIDKFEIDFQHDICATLDYAYIELSRGDDLNIRKEKFELMKLVLEYRVFHYNNGRTFPFIPYKTFLKNALCLCEFEWVEKFIEEFCPQLEEDCVENMHHYSYAFLHRAKGENEKSLLECSRVKFDNIILNCDIKLLTLMNYYELKEFDTAVIFIDSFTHFLHSNKNISEKYRIYFGNFVKAVKRLILLNNSGCEHKKLNSLKYDIENYETTYDRNWLLNNISMLETKFKN